jgi:hypothetical protein
VIALHINVNLTFIDDAELRRQCIGCGFPALAVQRAFQSEEPGSMAMKTVLGNIIFTS